MKTRHWYNNQNVSHVDKIKSLENLICLGQNWRVCLVLDLMKYLTLKSLVLISLAYNIFG